MTQYIVASLSLTVISQGFQRYHQQIDLRVCSK